MFHRRTLIQGALATLAAPHIAAAQDARVLRFTPQADLVVLDPIWTTAEVTRNHGLLVFDTLFGIDADLRPVPQMAEWATTADDGKLWTVRLRDGLGFHDGTPVLARDVVASLQRWGKRDGFGQVLMGVTDEIRAADDRTVVIRLKRAFPLLADALGKVNSNMAVIMPERLANTDAGTQVTEMVGSGPYRFKADERVSGSRVVYERFAGYKPRESGTPTWTAGPKIARFERIEWQIIPDGATAAAALKKGEIDWWEWPIADLLPLLGRDPGVEVAVKDRLGNIAVMRMNHLQPPFDNPAIRRAMLGAVSQEDYMAAVAGNDRSLWHTPIGFFTPGTPLANDVGIDVFKGPRDMAKVQRDLKAAGYAGENIVLLGANDLAVVKAECDVGADMMTRAGLNVDYLQADWGTVVTRRAKKDPPDKGGWNVFYTGTRGVDQINPANHIALRANGGDAWPGWPSSAKLEQLRTDWFYAPDLDAQKRIAIEMQKQAFLDVPYIPLGHYLTPTAYRKTLDGVLDGVPVFWGVHRS
jgi:peptide/nickel transport system substrate-binding protein